MMIVRVEMEKSIQIVRGASKMKKLGRPRKSVRKENISVNLPSYLIKQISDKLSWSSSRSVWIQDAIEIKLRNKNNITLQDADTLTLISVLRNRDISDFIRRALESEYESIYLQTKSTSKKPIEETEEQQ